MNQQRGNGWLILTACDYKRSTMSRREVCHIVCICCCLICMTLALIFGIKVLTFAAVSSRLWVRFDVFTLMFFLLNKSCKRALRVCLLCLLYFAFCQVRFAYTSAIVFVSMKNEVSD